MTNPSTGELVAKYLQIRDKKKELQDAHKEQLAPYNAALQKLEDIFQKQMQDQGLKNLTTDGGTAYQSEQVSVKVADWDLFKDYIIAGGLWHMLDQRANKTAVQEVIAETQQVPPGLNVTRVNKVNVRRS